MLQQDKPDGYVVATGRTTTIREFCELAFPMSASITATTSSVGATCCVRQVDVLLGDASKARRAIGLAADNHTRRDDH